MFKIGEFSRLSRVSVRMLRYYDQLGLLKPSQTDPQTGYRYYSADQLPRLNRILAYQDLGFSLKQIAGLLDDDLPAEQLQGMLRLKRAEIEQGLQAEWSRLSRLEARLRQENGARPPYDVVLRSLVPACVASLRAVVPNDQRIQFMFHELEIYVAGFRDARLDQPPFTVYYDAEYRDRDIDAEVAVPLKYAIPSSASIRVYETAAVPCAACVVHTGTYDTLSLAYNALLAWVDANPYRMDGPIREVYLRYGAEGLGFDLPPTFLAQGSDAFVTELQLPVASSSAAAHLPS